MKHCLGCGREKPRLEFHANASKKDGLQTTCIECCRKRYATWYRANTALARQRSTTSRTKTRAFNRGIIGRYLAEHPCVDCGETDPVVLEFDHREPAAKRDHVSQLVGDGVSSVRLEQEIAKCDVRCANCHKRRTAKQFGWWKS